MSTLTLDLPANARPSLPVTEDIGGTGVSNELGNTITLLGGAIVMTVPNGGSAVTFPASGTIPSIPTDGTFSNDVELDSATPGTVSSISGTVMNEIEPAMTSGNLNGLFGEVSIPALTEVSGGTLNGVHGTLTVEGELSGTSIAAAVKATLAIDTATLTAGEICCILADAGVDGPSATVAGFNMIRINNDTSTTVNSYLSAFGKASYFADIDQDGSSIFVNAGTSAGSAGDATKCAAQKVLKIAVDGVDYFIAVFDQNT